MADEGKKKKFVVEEVVGDEPVHSEDLEKGKVEATETPEEQVQEETPVTETNEESAPVTVEEAEEQNKDEITTESSESAPITETEGEKVPELPMSAEPMPHSPAGEQKTNMKLVIILTAFIALLLGGIAGGVLVFISSGQNDLTNVESSPSPLATVVPTATPEPEVDKQSFTVTIQNGSGIAGEGGRMSQLLTTEGFKVGTVGNASSFDHEDTIIQVKDSVSEAFVDLLSETLSQKYKMGDAEKLPETSSSDIVVVVGSEKP